MAATEERDHRRFTIDDVATMLDAGILAEDEPVELLEGELLLMSPQNPAHVWATERIARLLGDLYAGRAHTRSHSPLEIDRETVPEPDVALVRGDLDDYATRLATGRDALLVVEVAQTSHARDRLKVAHYARGGVPVYWLLDLRARRLEVRTAPRDGEYTVVRVLQVGDEVELPDDERRIAVRELFPPD